MDQMQGALHQNAQAALVQDYQNAYCAPVEKPADFLSRMMANIGQDQTTLRKADYLRLCQMAAKGL